MVDKDAKKTMKEPVLTEGSRNLFQSGALVAGKSRLIKREESSDRIFVCFSVSPSARFVSFEKLTGQNDVQFIISN